LTNVDSVLNLAWALLCVTVLATHWIRERRSASLRTQRVRVQRLLSVILAVISLFPCISASDDGIRLRDLINGPPSQQAFTASTNGNLPLTAQLEDLEHAQIAVPFRLVLVLCFLLLVTSERSESLLNFHVDSLTRGPPLATA
jgi:hypothetical protein